MSRWIDADDIKNAKFQEKNLRGVGEHIAYRVGWNEAIESILENALSIDIVRCKDCKYGHNIESEWICEHLSGMAVLNVLVNPDDFCSYGEARESE